jgi:hypothetical protein
VTKDIFAGTVPVDRDGTVPVFQYRVPTREEASASEQEVNAVIQRETKAFEGQRYQFIKLMVTSSLISSVPLAMRGFALWQQGQGQSALLGAGLVGAVAAGIVWLFDHQVQTLREEQFQERLQTINENAARYSGAGYGQHGRLEPTRPDPLGPASGFSFRPDPVVISDREVAAKKILPVWSTVLTPPLPPES